MADRNYNDEIKREMLAAIREQLAASKPFDAVHTEHQAQHAVSDGNESTRSTHSARHDAQSASGLVARFRESLEAIGGRCSIVDSEDAATVAVQRIVEQTQARQIAISNSPLVESVVNSLKWDGELLEKAEAAALFACDLGLTGAQWGIAETGTLVLESGRERHRLVSLVPPVHVALIRSQQICETLAEALNRISENGEEGLSRAVTFITGPSRTSDIELTLAIGVHGPAQLHVIIIEEESAAHR